MPKVAKGQRGYDRSVQLGNAGEHLVMSHLLDLNFQAFRADRGNPAFDISVVDGKRHSLLRVKTTRAASLVWTRKKSGLTFLDMREEGDFCCIVDLRQGVRAASVYLVPTNVVLTAINEGRRYFLSTKKRDGTDKVDSTGQRLWLNARADRHAYEGFAEKWKPYLWNWAQLRDTDASRS